MSVNGALVYDPAVAGVAGATLPLSGAGGGSISGAGSYYSKPSTVGHSREDISEIVVVTGTLTGTLTIEVSNDSEEADRAGTAAWVTFTATIPAISGAASFGLSNVIRYTRYRLKFVWASGSGTISSRRTIKGTT